MAPRFGTDGVRGVANQELTPAVATALGRAAAAALGDGPYVVGRDPRRSGPMLEAALIAGLCAGGADVELLGLVPTPAVAWVSAQRGIPGAMISASHNPFGDNGIKLFAAGGLKLDDAAEAEIEAAYLALLEGSGEVQDPPIGADVGTVLSSPGIEGWIESLCSSIEGRRLSGMTIALDCANGAATGHAARVFTELGAKVHVIGDEPNGININDGYGSTAPGLLSKAVVEHGADLGLAFDGDADRLIAVDETGSVVDGDRVLAILALDWSPRARLADDTVVVTVMSNLGFHRAMAAAGIKVVTTDVGDRSVLQALDEGRFSLGGEQSGHVICRELATTGDGVLSGVQLADVVARSPIPLSRLAVDAMTTVPQILRNVRLPRHDPTLLARMGEDVSAVETRFGDDGRVLVRLSGTEPLLRVMVEHVDPNMADEGCDRLVEVAQRLVSSP